jgi:hypothetical protein
MVLVTAPAADESLEEVDAASAPVAGASGVSASDPQAIPPKRPSSLSATAVDESLADTVEDLAMQTANETGGSTFGVAQKESELVDDEPGHAAILPTDDWTSEQSRQGRAWLMLGGAVVAGITLAILLFGYVVSMLTENAAAKNDPPQVAGQTKPFHPDSEQPQPPTGQPSETDRSTASADDDTTAGTVDNQVSAVPVPATDEDYGENIGGNAPASESNAPASESPVKEPEVSSPPTVGEAEPANDAEPLDLAGTPETPAAGRMTSSGSLSETLRQFEALLEQPEGFLDPSDSEMEEIESELPADDEKSAPRLMRPEPREIDVAARLDDPVQELHFEDVPLIDFVRFLTQFSTMPITVHPESLIWLRLSPNHPLTVHLDGATVEEILTSGLQPLGLAWETDDQQILVRRMTTNPDAYRRVTFDLTDLSDAPEDANQIAEVITDIIAPETWTSAGGTGTIEVDGTSLIVRQREEVLFDALFLCESLRVARGLAPRGRYAARYFASTTRRDRARPALEKRITASFIRPTSLPEVLHTIERSSGVRLIVDWYQLSKEGWTPDTELTFTCVETSLAEALPSLLESMDLSYRVVDDALFQVTTQQGLEEIAELQVYPASRWIGTGETPTEALARVQSGLAIDARFAVDPASQALLVVADPISHQSLEETLRKDEG